MVWRTFGKRIVVQKMNEKRRKIMTDITYRVEGNYLIPNLILDDEEDDSPEEMIGRYGLMRENFLREIDRQEEEKWNVCLGR